VLRQGVQGITDLITVPGLINLDFADVRTIMKDTGTALMGIGSASGDTRANEAATQAIASPLLETSISGARGILLNITGGKDLSLYEVNDAAQAIGDAAHDEANIIFGAVVDERLEGRMTVTVIATGFDGQSRVQESSREEAEPREPRRPSEPVFEPPPRFDDELDVPSFVRRPEE
jgi:cell division protein FtsZ